MMALWFIFILAVLATHRLTVFITEDDGPWWMFWRLRQLPPPRSNAREGINCFRCVSVYMATAISLFLAWQEIIPWPWLPIFILAVSSAAICLDRLTNKSNG